MQTKPHGPKGKSATPKKVMVKGCSSNVLLAEVVKKAKTKRKLVMEEAAQLKKKATKVFKAPLPKKIKGKAIETSK